MKGETKIGKYRNLLSGKSWPADESEISYIRLDIHGYS